MEQGENKRISNPPKFQVDEFDQKAIFLCQFCGGRTCDQEDFRANKIQPNAIEGLHSNWITPNILAMQRPSQRLIKEYGLYARFKELNIKTVLNLQEPGEHPYCGDGIIPTVGFSYIPQNFFSHGIRCFNESWEDMTATTFDHMMNIMNLFDLTISEGGKISVHCHAGRGRTLLVICSWLIYHDRMTAKQTIQLATQKRQGVLTRSSQREFLAYFQAQLKLKWRSYGISPLHKTFTQFTEWQSGSILKREKRKLQKMPILHYKIVSRLRTIVGKEFTRVIQAFLTPFSLLFEKKWSETHQKEISLRKQQINTLNFTSIQNEEDPRMLLELFFDFYNELPYTIITSHTVETLQQLSSHNNKSRLQILMEPAIVHDLGVSGFAIIIDICHFVRSLSKKMEREKCESQTEKQTEKKVNETLTESLYMRIALALLSKRQFSPQLFPTQNRRDCKIYRYIAKINKIVSSHALFLRNFLQSLSQELPQQLQQAHKIIFKACKVDSNLYYLTKKQTNLLSNKQKQEIYTNARIKY